MLKFCLINIFTTNVKLKEKITYVQIWFSVYFVGFYVCRWVNKSVAGGWKLAQLRKQRLCGLKRTKEPDRRPNLCLYIDLRVSPLLSATESTIFVRPRFVTDVKRIGRVGLVKINCDQFCLLINFSIVIELSASRADVVVFLLIPNI